MLELDQFDITNINIVAYWSLNDRKWSKKVSMYTCIYLDLVILQFCI